MDGIRIYPNPGTGIYNLSFGQVPSNTIRITILDITGKIIGISEIQDPIRNVEYKLDLEAYEDGIYQVSINSGQMLYHRILIKE